MTTISKRKKRRRTKKYDTIDGVGRSRTQDVERRQGFTRPDHRSRRFSASTGEEGL